MSKTLIVIPARMASTRFPAKPLAEIAGVSMVRRTAAIAQNLAQGSADVEYIVATDHEDITHHCDTHHIQSVITDADLASGSDRALVAAQIQSSATGHDYNYVLNLQGDAPFTPPEHVMAVLQTLKNSGADIATPYIKLSWSALDRLREDKRKTPFSGTSLIADRTGRALWFSKNIIPALRGEDALRSQSELSPICRHIGLYGYRLDALQAFTNFPQSRAEKLEGLEQLRALENGLSIQTIEVSPPKISSPGIDTPEDLARAEALIAKYGDPFYDMQS